MRQKSDKSLCRIGVFYDGWYQGLFRGLFRQQEKDEKLEQKGSLISP